jgi:hypothetical protein
MRYETGQEQLLILEEPKLEKPKLKTMTLSKFQQEQKTKIKSLTEQNKKYKVAQKTATKESFYSEYKQETILKQKSKIALFPIYKVESKTQLKQTPTPIVKNIVIAKPEVIPKAKVITSAKIIPIIKPISLVKATPSIISLVKPSSIVESKSRLKLELKQVQEARFKLPEGLPKSQPPVGKLYQAFIKRGKDFEPIGGAMTLNRALKYGSETALRTLRATFKVKEVGATREQDISFKPSEKFFKESKTVKGREVATPLTFIQKKGTRLSSQTERREIQSFRKLKLARMNNYAI